jgi:hypothetical protein
MGDKVSSPDSNFLFSKECSVLKDGMRRARGAGRVEGGAEVTVGGGVRESERTFSSVLLFTKKIS